MQHYKSPSHRLISFIVTLTLCIGATVEAQQPAGDRTANALRAHITFLADDLLAGRFPGTAGYDIAARYVAAQFEQLGLYPAGDAGTYFQNVPIRVTRRDHDFAAMTLTSNGKSTELVVQQDFAIGASAVHAESSVSAPLVFVGFGVQAPRYDIDDYAGLDTEGKIVVMFQGAPSSLPGEVRAHYGSGATKSRTAADNGAIGLITLYTKAFETVIPFARLAELVRRAGMTWMESEEVPFVPAPEIRGGAILSPEASVQLFTGAPRSFSELQEEAVAGIPKGFALPVEATIKQRTDFEQIDSPNVIAVLEGSHPVLKSEYIVFTAHLDHDGIGDEIDGDDIYNGAADNASGTAVVLEVARQLKQNPPKRSVIFAIVTAEETGLVGADYLARHPVRPIEQIVANINIDGALFFFDFADILAWGAEHSSLGQNVLNATQQLGLGVGQDPAPEQGFFVRSDHYRFVQQGVPSLFLGVGLTSKNPEEAPGTHMMEYLTTHYHRPTDDMRLPFKWDAGAVYVKTVTGIARDVADADEAPKWHEGDFFGDLFRR